MPSKKSTPNRKVQLNKFFWKNLLHSWLTCHRTFSKSSRAFFKKVRINASCFWHFCFFMGVRACDDILFGDMSWTGVRMKKIRGGLESHNSEIPSVLRLSPEPLLKKEGSPAVLWGPYWLHAHVYYLRIDFPLSAPNRAIWLRLRFMIQIANRKSLAIWNTVNLLRQAHCSDCLCRKTALRF